MKYNLIWINLLSLVFCVVFLYGFKSAVHKGKQTPNILLIVSEDNGPDLGCYGNENVHTPVLDQLAESGVRFDNAYVTYSVCSPSRSTLFTGLYPHQNGQIGLATHKYRMFKDFTSLPEYLKEKGYRTACLGKLHVNPESAIPFDYREIKGSNFAKRGLERYAAKAKDFVEQSDDPFFLMVNFPDAHFPVQKRVEGRPTKIVEPDELETSLPFVGLTSERLKDYTANYYNCMNRLDESVGMLLDELKSIKALENTVIIYLGDHGAQFSRGKCSNYEGALKVPMMISWPDVIKPDQNRTELISSIDIVPTILDIANVDKPAELPGYSFIPLCAGESYNKRDYLFADGAGATPRMYFPRRSVRGERYKLIHNLLRRENPHVAFYEQQKGHFEAGTSKETVQNADSIWKNVYATWKNPPEFELYDLQNDPLETVNLAHDDRCKTELNRLKKALVNWQNQTNDPLADEKRLNLLSNEMDSIAAAYPNLGYRKKKGFEWQYPYYLID